MFQPRRKDALDALEAITPEAAALVRRWHASSGEESLTIVAELARLVMGVDGFFAWTSERDVVG